MFSFKGDAYTSCLWLNSTCAELTICGQNLCAGNNINSLKLLLPNDVIAMSESTGLEQSINVSSPQFPVQPNVYLSVSAGGGQCKSGIVIDASATYGQGGRAWKEIRWTVLTGNSTVPDIVNYLSGITDLSSPITIPYELLHHES